MESCRTGLQPLSLLQKESPENEVLGPEKDILPLRLVLPGSTPIDLKRSGLVFGRHSQADVRLPLPDVSRRHCRFVFSQGGWQVIDLNSLNGIFVNGLRVSGAKLYHGDRLRIGGFLFEVVLGPKTMTRRRAS
jgi:pSer/pThr/pTyr-binding forkhead associated (FHA) protein